MENQITTFSNQKDMLIYEVHHNFKILHACDLHLSMGLFFYNNKTLNLLKKALLKEKPDLVVINGDLMYSMLNGLLLKKFADFMEKHNTYWSYVFGNHDDEFGYEKYELANFLSSYPHALFESNNKTMGCGNYFILLKNNNKIVFTLTMLDTSTKNIKKNQVEWFDQSIKQINTCEGKKIKNIVFMHIPLKEVKELAIGKNFTGSLLKEVKPLKKDNNFFKVANKNKSTVAIFNGHDHINNFGGMYKNIYLMSTLSCGYGGFTKKGIKKGFITIKINIKNGSFKIYTLPENKL